MKHGNGIGKGKRKKRESEMRNCEKIEGNEKGERKKGPEKETGNGKVKSETGEGTEKGREKEEKPDRWTRRRAPVAAGGQRVVAVGDHGRGVERVNWQG